jgi:hypothetical protein
LRSFFFFALCPVALCHASGVGQCRASSLHGGGCACSVLVLHTRPVHQQRRRIMSRGLRRWLLAGRGLSACGWRMGGRWRSSGERFASLPWGSCRLRGTMYTETQSSGHCAVRHLVMGSLLSWLTRSIWQVSDGGTGSGADPLSPATRAQEAAKSPGGDKG